MTLEQFANALFLVGDGSARVVTVQLCCRLRDLEAPSARGICRKATLGSRKPAAEAREEQREDYLNFAS